LFNDTEVNVAFRDESLARETRIRLWAEHLERGPEELHGDPTEIVDELWRPLADDKTHRLSRLANVSRRSKTLPRPLPTRLGRGRRRDLPRPRERDLLAPDDDRRRDPPPPQRVRGLPAHGRVRASRARRGGVAAASPRTAGAGRRRAAPDLRLRSSRRRGR